MGRKFQEESPRLPPGVYSRFKLERHNKSTIVSKFVTAAAVLANRFQQALAQTGISLPPTVSSKEPLRSPDGQRFLRSDAPSSEPPKPGARMVHCVKFGRELPGLDRVPWRGELGKRVYESVSKDAWKLWIEHSKMVMNEYRLNPLDPNSQKIMEEQMELFFFGAGSALPEGYVAPKGKG